MIDLKKPIKLVIKTNDGWTATVVSDKGRQPWPLIGVVSNAKHAVPMQWTADGTAMEGNHWDICNVPEKIKVDVWLNVYKYPHSRTVFTTTHNTLSDANNHSTYTTIGWSAPRFTCLHVEAEVEEGFGITPPPATDEE